MRIICAWCSKLIGNVPSPTREDPDDARTSHGICPPCMDDMMRSLDMAAVAEPEPIVVEVEPMNGMDVVDSELWRKEQIANGNLKPAVTADQLERDDLTARFAVAFVSQRGWPWEYDGTDLSRKQSEARQVAKAAQIMADAVMSLRGAQ